ncbi:MAG: hypothetical protein PHY93_13785 [Bacteriovorax sp.]|nr:hypothetical protein [Bacteriovorax sp.]
MHDFKLAVMKFVLVFAVLSTLTLGLLWGRQEKANYAFEGGEISAFFPVNNWSETNPKLVIDAKGWANETVEAQIIIRAIRFNSEISQYSFNGSSWQKERVEMDNNNYPLELAKFQSTSLTFPSVTTIPKFEEIKNLSIGACLRIKGQENDFKDCATRGYSLNLARKNASTTQGTLSSSSVRLNTELNLAVVNYSPNQTTQKIYFDLDQLNNNSTGGLFLFPEVTGKLQNFSQVKITVFPKDPNGNVVPLPFITIQNGIIKQNLQFSMGAENLQFSNDLKQNLNRFKEQMNFKGSQEELLKMLDNNLQANAKNVDPDLLADINHDLQAWDSNLLTVMNGGFGDQKTQKEAWVTGVWKPMFSNFRVEVEVGAGAPAFKLFAMLTPMQLIPSSLQLGLNWGDQFNKMDEMKWAAKELNLNATLPLNIRNKDMPSSVDDLSPACRAKVESPLTKLYTSLVFNGLAGGIVGKTVGGLGAAMGYAAPAIESAGTLAGWFSGGVFDALSPIDQAKFYISYYAANAFSYDVTTIDARIIGGKLAPNHPDFDTYCIGEPFKIRAVWYNECGRIMAGHNSEDYTRLTTAPRNIADVQLLGPANGVSGLVGSGAEYKITPVLVGKAKFTLYVHDLKHFREMEVNFVNCSSPLSNVNK